MTDVADVATKSFLSCLLDPHGELHVVRGPGACDLFWVGFLDEILSSIIKLD